MIYELDNAHDKRLVAKVCDRWCYFGGSSSSKSTTSNTIDPAQMAQYQQNYAGAQTKAGSLTPYTGQITAGFNPTQTQSQGILSGIAQDPTYQAANTNAMGITQGVANGAVPTVTPTPYTAGQLSNTDLSPYLNPYTNDVINTSLAQLNQQRGQQGVADNAQATSAGAFGGTRQAVQRALTTQGYDLNEGNLIAGLNSANFNQAQSGALSDIASRNAASQFNSGQNLTAQTTNAGNQLAFGNQRLNAAGQLSDLNNNALSLAAKQGGILAAVGDTQQAQQQKALTDAYNAYTQGQQLTLTQQQILNQALGIIPIQQTTNSDSQTHTSPGVGGILGGVASLGLAAATGGSSLGLSGALGGLGGLFGSGTQNPAFTTNGQAYY